MAEKSATKEEKGVVPYKAGLQGWSDEVRAAAIQIYEDTASVHQVVAHLKKAGYTNNDGAPPSKRSIIYWINAESETRGEDLRKLAAKQRRNNIAELAWDKAEEVADKLTTAEDGKNTYGYAGAFKTLYDLGSKAESESDSSVVDEWFAVLGKRTRSHAGLTYLDGTYREIE